MTFFRCRFGGNRGTAAIEFALVAPILLAVAGGTADFGIAFSDQMQLQYAVQSGAQYAFAAQQATSPGGTVSSSSVQTATQAATNLSNVSITVKGPFPSCFQDATGSATLTGGSYGTPCPNGNPVGTYMIIKATYAYQPLMPFYSQLASRTLTVSETVRLY